MYWSKAWKDGVNPIFYVGLVLVAAGAVTGDCDSGRIALVASNFALHPKHRTEHIFDDLIERYTVTAVAEQPVVHIADHVAAIRCQIGGCLIHDGIVVDQPTTAMKHDYHGQRLRLAGRRIDIHGQLEIVRCCPSDIFGQRVLGRIIVL